MKVHISFSGVRAGTMDLDKKMPEFSKIYPEGFKEEVIEFCNANNLFVASVDKIEK